MPFHFTDDPNFPIFYQKLIASVVLGLSAFALFVFCALVIGAVISWMNSGSH